MEDNKDNSASKKYVFSGMAVGTLIGLSIIHKNKKTGSDYVKGIAGGLVAGALAGIILSKFQNGSASKTPSQDLIKLSASDKRESISLERTI